MRHRIDGSQPSRARADRLGFRVDRQTKIMIERAAQLERRNLTDFCMVALAEAAQRTIERHAVLTLSDNDRKVFFDALMRTPKPNPRLRKAFRVYRERMAS